MLIKLSLDSAENNIPSNKPSNTKRYIGAGAGGLAAGFLAKNIAPLLARTPAMELAAQRFAGPLAAALAAKGILGVTSGDKKNDNVALAGGIGAIGAHDLIMDAYNSGELTGRVTLWHGTSPKSKKSILREGIHVTTPKNSVDTINLKNYNEDIYNRAMNNVYLTKDPSYAKFYAGQATGGGTKEFFKRVAKDQKYYFKAMREGAKNGMVKVNLPVDIYNKKIINPEVDMPFERYKYFGYAPGKHPANEYNNLRVRGVVLPQDVSTKWIHGAEGYEKNTVRGILNHIKSHPKMFARGAAKTGLGALGLAAAAYAANKIYKNRKGQNQDASQNIQSK